jgi:hypothetical protein
MGCKTKGKTLKTTRTQKHIRFMTRGFARFHGLPNSQISEASSRQPPRSNMASCQPPRGILFESPSSRHRGLIEATSWKQHGLRAAALGQVPGAGFGPKLSVKGSEPGLNWQSRRPGLFGPGIWPAHTRFKKTDPKPARVKGVTTRASRLTAKEV